MQEPNILVSPVSLAPPGPTVQPAAPVRAPAQQVTMFESHVELRQPDGTTKAITLASFYDILTQAMSIKATSVKSNFLLPAGCYNFGVSATSLQLSCYYPGKVRAIKFDNSRDGEKIKEFQIPFPNILITHTLTKSKDEWRLSSTHYFCTNLGVNSLPTGHPIRNPAGGIWHVPLPNMYTDGRMCYGGNSLIVNFPLDNLRGLDWYFRMLFESPFNTDLGVQELSDSSGVKAWLTHLDTIGRAGGEFPYKKLRG